MFATQNSTQSASSVTLSHPAPSWIRKQAVRVMAVDSVGASITLLRVKLAPQLDKWLWEKFGITSTELAFPSAVLETVGRKTGAVRQTPTIYFKGNDGSIYITATNGGKKGNPAWLTNLKRQKSVSYFTREKGVRRTGQFEAEVFQANDEKHRHLFNEMLKVAPFLKTYVNLKNQDGETTDVMPVVRLKPLDEAARAMVSTSPSLRSLETRSLASSDFEPR